jgi:hypothetical protein
MTLIWRNWKKNLRHSSRYRKKRKASRKALGGKQTRLWHFWKRI